MTSLWPQLQYPWLLMLVPLAWLLLLLRYRQQHQPAWEQRLPASFRPWLVARHDQPGERWPYMLLALAALLSAIALANPRWSASQHSTQQVLPPPLILLLELTPDMQAGDLAPSRLHHMRHKAAQLLRLQAPGESAVILYAGSAHVMTPLSNDPEVALNMLPALAPGLMPLPGRDAGNAVRKALELLTQRNQTNGRLLLLTRDLSTDEQTRLRQLLQGSGHSLHILGVGTPQGSPLPAADGRFNINAALSQLEEARLQAFVDSLSAAGYARMSLDSTDLEQAGLLENNPQGQQRMRLPPTLESFGHWFLLPLLLVLVPLGRRGWYGSAILLLALSLPQTPTLASDWPVSHEPPTTTAADDPFWQAVADYQQGQYQQAAEGFARVPGAIAHYNRGNSLLQLQRPQEARQAYLQALELMPGLPQAVDNLALAEQLLQTTNQPDTQQGQGEPEEAAEDSQADENKTATLNAHPSGPDHHDPDTWLRQIPDHPGELLRQRFWNEQFRNSE